VIAVGGYRQAFDSAEDYDLWVRLSERYPLANMPDVLVDYRWHGDNTTVRRRRKQALGAHIAKLAAAERRRGRPDPTSRLEQLCVAHLDRFDLPKNVRGAILRDLSEAGLVAYDATGDVRHLADVEESLFAASHRNPADAASVACRGASAQHSGSRLEVECGGALLHRWARSTAPRFAGHTAKPARRWQLAPPLCRSAGVAAGAAGPPALAGGGGNARD